MRSGLSVGVVVVVLFAAASLASASTIYYSTDFAGADGADPAGWSDPSSKHAISGNDYLLSYSSATSGEAVAYFNAGSNTAGWANYSDYVVTAKIDDVSMNTDGSAVGILGRVVSANTFYHLRYRYDSATSTTVQLYVFNGGTPALLNGEGMGLDFDANDYYFRLAFEGTSILAQIATDAAFTNLVYDYATTNSAIASGGVGLRSYHITGTNGLTTMLVDNLEVTAVPEPSALALALLGLVGALVYTRRRMR